MNTRFGLICAAVAVMFAGSLHAAAPDTEIKITKTTYTAGSPSTANPEGTWKKPAGVAWKIIWDYGTLNGQNMYTRDTSNGAPLGGSKNLDDTTTSGTWGPLASAENLPSTIPANYKVRVRLLKLVGNDYETQLTDYAPLPPPK